MNNYQFPDNVQISENAKDIIQRILTNDPAKRPSIDEILAHQWIDNGGRIPKYLPPSTLACPPSTTYLKQFMAPESGGPTGGLASTQQVRSAALLPGRDGDTAGGMFTDRAKTAQENRAKVGVARESEVWVKKWVDY